MVQILSQVLVLISEVVPLASSQSAVGAVRCFFSAEIPLVVSQVSHFVTAQAPAADSIVYGLIDAAQPTVLPVVALRSEAVSVSKAPMNPTVIMTIPEVRMSRSRNKKERADSTNLR
jgi:hypothetical protein